MFLSRLLATIAGCASLAHAINFKGSVESNNTLSLNAYASLTWSGGEQKAPIVKDKSFEFYGLKEGEYALRVWDFKYSFLTYAVRLSESKAPEIHVYQLGAPTFIPTGVPSLPYPISVPVFAEQNYEDKQEPFNPIKMIRQNPMILMIVVGGGLALGMPALLKWIDPEVMKEVEQNQADLHAKVASFGNVDFAGSLSKRLAPTTESGASTPAKAATPSPGPGTPSKSGGGNKGRKRK